MEKVQFQIESTLPELKDLDEKGLFTKTELGQITARRTKFETALVKRVPKKQDFFDYAQYEIGLERLRRARYKRLRLDKSAQPRSISTHSIQRRILYILRRATDKFPYDLAVWLAYIDYARSEGMTKVVQQGLTTALQLHPRSPALYILLSQHYLDPSAPAHLLASSSAHKRRKHHQPNFAIENVSPARKTLLLGLRFMPTDKDLWREYIKLEIGWVEALRRRWKVLGIDLAGDGEGQGKMEEDVQAGLPRTGEEDEDEDEQELDLGQNAFGQSGEEARKAIVRGDLIVTVLQSAFANSVLGKDLDFHRQLVGLLRRYPTGLRLRLLDVVYTHMEEEPSLRWNPVARRIVIERSLFDAEYNPEQESKRALEGQEDEVVLQGEDFVLELGKIVKQLREKNADVAGQPKNWEQMWNQEVGFWLLCWAEKMADNEDLQAYLVASVNPLTKPTAHPTETLLIRHLEYITSLEDASRARPSPEKLLSLTKSYTVMYPSSSALWVHRLNAENALSDDKAALATAYLQAMTAVGASENAIAVWRAAMHWFDEQVPSTGDASMEPHWQQAIKAARKFVGDVHTHGDLGEQLYASLLLAWVEKKLGRDAPVPVASVRQIVSEVCGPTWDAPFQLLPPLFQIVANHPAPAAQLAPILSTIHGLRLQKARNELDRVDAVLEWASWVLTKAASSGTGQVRSAWTAIENLKKEVEAREVKDGIAQIEEEKIKQAALDKLESGWKAILAEVEAERAEEEDDVDME